jgi:phosphoribosylaminoimidazole carboxylase PurE protein
MTKPLVGIIMGSDSDLDVMSEAAKVLDEFNVPNEVRIISAHRTPDEMMTYAAKAKGRGHDSLAHAAARHCNPG